MLLLLQYSNESRMNNRAALICDFMLAKADY